MPVAFNVWTPRRGYLPALSIRQPWAWLIVQGHKDIENRDWKTAYRGQLLIHAGKVFDRDAVMGAYQGMPMREEDYATGGIVGIATLTDIVTSSASPWFAGRYGFVLKDVRPLPFMPYSGQLGLFAVPDIALKEMPEKRKVWRGCCQHCNRGVSVCGELNEQGFCAFCLARGYDSLPESQPTEEPTAICIRTANSQPITGWHIGDECRVDGYYIGCVGGRMYDARIVTLAHENGVQVAELRITASAKGFDGKPIVQSWVHPKMIPTAKLRKALLK